ncbi:hypothetical protein [Bifidobacterium cuniculi]|uniref:Uncharacterized protein n=1 Tax=Bifidobacterium cuniculi TaxID=1688 RepID=A0A087AZR0_9BIFI|nr:hypothetical protein [Bifidobacterium cuniculi]KFI64260.1 hypothetical protein BCUN_2125 [Bifidobacterium cuniculi]
MACILALAAGCSQTSATDGSPQASDTVTAQEQGSKRAGSLSERIEFLMDYADNNADHAMSERQQAILERALANDGIITKADYDQAWSNFSTCLTDKGYNPPVTARYQDGVHGNTFMVDVGDRGEEVDEKVHQDLSQCLDLEFLSVDELYRAAVGNPNLYQQNEVALADCLRRKNLVEVSYTSSRYLEERQRSWDLYDEAVAVSNDPASAWDASKAGYSFDLDNPDIQLCFVTSGIDIRSQDPGAQDEVTWKVFD